jgi:hypothetical protein
MPVPIIITAFRKGTHHAWSMQESRIRFSTLPPFFFFFLLPLSSIFFLAAAAAEARRLAGLGDRAPAGRPHARRA